MYNDIILQPPRSNIKVVLNKDDSGDIIRITFNDGPQTAKNITGWGGRVVAFSSESGATYMVSGSITVISGSAGTLSYTVSGADTDTGGRFPARLTLTSGVQAVSVTGWEIHVTPIGSTPSKTEYCSVSDVLNTDKNLYTLLRLESYSPEDIRVKIQEWSARINSMIGAQSSGDDVIRLLCQYLIFIDIGNGLPAAQRTGDDATSYLGTVSKWQTEVDKILADYGYTSDPDPEFTEP